MPGSCSCPILLLDATNYQHGKMEWASKTLDLVPPDVRWAFTPRATDTTSRPSQGIDLTSLDGRLSEGGRKVPPQRQRSRDSAWKRRRPPGHAHTGHGRPHQASGVVLRRRKPQSQEPILAIGHRPVQCGRVECQPRRYLIRKEPLFSFANVTYESRRLPVVEFGDRRPGTRWARPSRPTRDRSKIDDASGRPWAVG